MSATVEIAERNGTSPGTETDGITNMNMGSTDAPNLNPTTYPITAPGQSYEKWERVYVSNMGGSTTIDNIRVWLSNIGSGFATGESLLCNMVTSGYTAAAYPAGGPTSAISTVATVSTPTSEPASANIGIAGVLSGSITAAPAYSDYFVMQEQVTSSTPAGALQTKTLSIMWDES